MRGLETLDRMHRTGRPIQDFPEKRQNVSPHKVPDIGKGVRDKRGQVRVAFIEAIQSIQEQPSVIEYEK